MHAAQSAPASSTGPAAARAGARLTCASFIHLSRCTNAPLLNTTTESLGAGKKSGHLHITYEHISLQALYGIPLRVTQLQ